MKQTTMSSRPAIESKRVVLLSALMILFLSADCIFASPSSEQEVPVSRTVLRNDEGSGRRLWFFSWTSFWEHLGPPHHHDSGGSSGSSSRNGNDDGGGSVRTNNDDGSGSGGPRMSIAAMIALIVGAVALLAAAYVAILIAVKRRREKEAEHPLDGGVAKKMALLDTSTADNDLESVSGATEAVTVASGPTIINLAELEDNEVYADQGDRSSDMASV